MEADNLTEGQRLAFDQLQEICSAACGALQIVDVGEPEEKGDPLRLRLSIDTQPYERVEGGFSFRSREPINIAIPSRFPIEHPKAEFVHKRFKGYPHVQWGNSMCLYVAPDVEWSAKDGMFGFVERLNHWLQDAALNKLDPDNAPLHPPAIYSRSDIGFVFELDAPEIAADRNFWLGTAQISQRNKVCFDVVDWGGIPKTLPDDKKYAACLLLNTPLPMEYPDTVLKLICELVNRQIPFDFLFQILKLFALYQKDKEPLYLVLGAPMRRRMAGEAIRQHLAVWRVDPESVAVLKAIVVAGEDEEIEGKKGEFFKWALTAKTDWCSVYDNRKEVTYRRDQDTNASWLLEKRVAILGCGALGSHIAEYVVRAGAAKIRLLDRAAVKPGVLVRQQFEAYQVGFTKESALKVHLSMINPNADVAHLRRDLRKGLPDDFKVNDFDLIIDATASRHVEAALQLQFENEDIWPPMMTCSIDGTASKGIAIMRMQKNQNGPCDLSRLTKEVAFSHVDLTPFVEAFWPAEQTSPIFQPEPGCSEPTFVGSASDVAFFASSFFDFALRVSQNAKEDASYSIFVSKAQRGTLGGSISSKEIPHSKPLVTKEVINGYKVVVSERAKSAIEAEITRNTREGSSKNETGGLLLGEIDDSLSTIYLDVATGAPPDSFKSTSRFECGIEGTAQVCSFHQRKSEGSTRFIGVWHTHPTSLPEPSSIDLNAMLKILHFQENPPRHVVMLIVGKTLTNPIWQFHFFRRNQFVFMESSGNE
ncbi:ThiF family adenylyltransferase [Pelobacter seleniigenes]|uniref:ThiF family adenylyltransferase n=1 Tax=Pelobacter seleniigenes TaxID=407188 RepID=UPI0004A6AC25|nr:ThiF family adenylyltransferase [Pelobacter seleniigenes]